jgi:hypothetical protein
MIMMMIFFSKLRQNSVYIAGVAREQDDVSYDIRLGSALLILFPFRPKRLLILFKYSKVGQSCIFVCVCVQ